MTFHSSLYIRISIFNFLYHCIMNLICMFEYFVNKDVCVLHCEELPNLWIRNQSNGCYLSISLPNSSDMHIHIH